MDILMYSILLYLHTSTHATSYIGLIQQDKRGYNHRLTLEGAISVGSVTKRSPLANKRAVFDALQIEQIKPHTYHQIYFFNTDGAMW